MNPSREELLKNYRQSLESIADVAESRSLAAAANVYRDWAAEISHSMTEDELHIHARKSARSLGGMESVGEIARVTDDKAMLDAVDALYRSAKAVEASRNIF